jgi:hypothetical protein
MEEITRVDWSCVAHLSFCFRKLYTEPSVGASYQISVHLATRLQRRRLFSELSRKKNCLCWPCLLTDQNKMSHRYRGPSIDASYQVSVPMAKWFTSRRLNCEKITDDGWHTTDDRGQVMRKVHIAFGKVRTKR